MGDFKEDDLCTNAGTRSSEGAGSLESSELVTKFGQKSGDARGQHGSQTENCNLKRQDRRRPENMEFNTQNKPESKQTWKP